MLWLVDAGLQAAPALFTAAWWRSSLAQSVMGEPLAINRSIYWVVDIITAHAGAWNAAFVAVQVAIGMALLLGRFDRLAIAASVPWALGIWWVGEGFGMIPTGFGLLAAGAPGAVILYALIGLLAWPRSDAGPGTRSAIAERAGIIAWVVLWAGQSLLQVPWKFSVGFVLQANVEEHSADQPSWLTAIGNHTEELVAHHAVALTIAMVVVQVAIGLGILARRTRRPAIGVAVLVCVVYWFAFQYLGGVAAGDATDPNSAPLLMLLAVALWPTSALPTLSKGEAASPPEATLGCERGASRAY